MNPYEAPQSGDAPIRKPFVTDLLLLLLAIAIPVMLILLIAQRTRVAQQQAFRVEEMARLQQLKAEAEKQ